MSLEAFQTVQS